MGFLKRLITKDPEAILGKAETALERGEGVDALARLVRLGDDLSAEQRQRAGELERRAHEVVCRAAVEGSSELEEAGLLEQALHRLEPALDHCVDEAERERLTAKQAELRARLEAELSGPDDLDGPEEDAADLDVDEAYDVLVGMLSEQMAEHHEGRSESFRQAFVDLHEGRAEAALAAFDELVAERPDDAACRLERGHCLLALGRAEEARPELEAAWEVLGDEPLDAAGSLTVPLLWADAALEIGDHEAVAERLAELGDPENRDVGLAQRLAVSLLALERHDEAVEHLEACCTTFPGEAGFAHDLGNLHASRGDRTRAIEVLERAVAPSCVGGGCGRPPMHVPSLRTLTALHLDDGNASRAGELVQFIQGARRGRLEAVDHLLLARLHRLRGDEDAVREQVGQARAVLPEDGARLSAALDELERGREAAGEGR